MNLEGKGSFESMGLRGWDWEEDINLIIDENNGIVERENGEAFSLSKSGEEDEIVGSLVEAAALLGLEDNNNKIMDENGRLIILQQESDNPVVPISISPIISNAKKEEHNAKERERRMKLSQTYFSLRSLLPNARRSKKRWSSTTIIDKVVDYIPTLQKEIEKLNQKKQDLMKVKEITNNNKKAVVDEEFDQNPSVCIHQVSRLGEVIIQICINQRNIMKLSTLIHKAELEALRIIGASAVSISDDHLTLTCHLHLQMDRSLQEAADYKSILRKRVISWLC